MQARPIWHDVIVERDAAVATVCLNRPNRRNALVPSMMDELAAVFTELAKDETVRAVVVTGAGGAFCAGGDVQAMAGDPNRRSGNGRLSSRPSVVTSARDIERITSAVPRLLATMPIPVLASIPGAVAGAGLGLALSCDLRVAAAGAVFTTGFLNVGLTDDWGASFFLTQLAGPSVARELLLLGERFDADRALQLGLVNRVVPAAELEAVTRDLASRLAALPPFAAGAIKANVSRALRGDLDDSLRMEALHHALAHHSDDHREAIRAMAEERAPRFTGS